MKKRLPGTSLCCALGACGAIACSIAMFAAPLGILGASVTAGAKADSMQSMGAMAGMSPTASAAAAAAHVPAWIALLNLFGPQLLIVSVVLVIAALAVRRSVFGALAAVAAGMLLYYGMYAQGI
jgi:nicotinic acid phosphoribosyltransferase